MEPAVTAAVLSHVTFKKRIALGLLHAVLEFFAVDVRVVVEESVVVEKMTLRTTMLTVRTRTKPLVHLFF